MFLFKKQHSSKQHWEQALKLRDPYRQEYNLHEAIDHFKRAISEKPDDYRYHFDLGRTYLDTPNLALTRGVNVSFKLEEAVGLATEEFKEAARLNPGFIASHLNLAHCYLIQGNRTAAVAAYTEYLKVTKQKLERPEPKKAPKQPSKTEKVEGPKMSLPEERLLNMEYALMKRRVKEAQPAKAEEHLQQAARYRMEGNYKKAAKELEKAYAVAEDVAWIYKRLYKLGR